ncbi:MAG: hypothetical protein ACFBSE_02960 [Prochloraceae cyanobacterium]
MDIDSKLRSQVNLVNQGTVKGKIKSNNATNSGNNAKTQIVFGFILYLNLLSSLRFI